MNQEAKVEFNLGKTKISTFARIPTPKGNIPEDGVRVLTINNAVSDIKKDTGINLKDLIDDVYSNAVILYV